MECSCTPCRPFRRARCPSWRLISPRVRIAGGKWRRCGRSSAPSSPGQPMCCAHRLRCGNAWRGESQRRRAKKRWCQRHTERLNRIGKKRRRVSLANCWRRIRRRTASACWYGSRREPPIRLIAMPESKSCICFDGELMVDDKKLYPGITSGRRSAAPISVSGARPAAPAFSSPPPETSFSDSWVVVMRPRFRAGLRLTLTKRPSAATRCPGRESMG